MNEKDITSFKFNAVYRKNNFNGTTSFLDGLIRHGNPLHAFCDDHYDAPHGRIIYTETPFGDNPRDVYVKGIISFANNTFNNKTLITPDATISDLITATWFAMNGTNMAMLERLTSPVVIKETLGDGYMVRSF